MTFSNSTTPFISRLKFTDPNFIDAMSVRLEVFVNEQHVPEENERDEYDETALHWVVYASIPSPSPPSLDPVDTETRRQTRNSIDGVLPEAELEQNRTPVGVIRLIPPSASKKPYILLGRLAVLKPFRSLGLARLLVEEALRYAEQRGKEGGFDSPADGIRWDGKCVIHAQKFVREWWGKQGFVWDEGEGEWEEEGIVHVLMVKELGFERRKNSIAI